MEQTQCKLEIISYFEKGQIILSTGDHTGRVGMIRNGQARVSFFDAEGNENLADYLREGDSFGEYFPSLPGLRDYEVIADSPCTVLFINIRKALAGCSCECGNHMAMLQKLVLLAGKRSSTQAEHIHILSQRTLRDKLMAYLSFQDLMNPGDSGFDLSISLGDLANYLSIDRSSMMREIRRMNDAGLIESRGRHFRILTAKDK